MSINVINSLKTTGDDLAPLVEQLAKRADADGDGKVSSSEFSNFLGQLIESLTGGDGAAAGGPRSATDGRSSVTPLVDTSDHAVAAATAADTPVPAGWNPEKWADESHQTPKYVIGRILAQYPPTPSGLTDAMSAIEGAYPGVSREGDDTINIPGVGRVDVGLQFANGGNVGWWWGPKD